MDDIEQQRTDAIIAALKRIIGGSHAIERSLRMNPTTEQLLCGDWIEFPGEHTKEEAIALAEAAVLLNLGGWP